MKTINEVIKALEYCLNPVDNFGNCNAECPYIHCCDPSNHDVTEDALHYLREYKKYTDTMCALPDYYDWVHSADNPPLSFEEVREMLGKPVWMEFSSAKGWRLVNWFDSLTTGEKSVALTDRYGVDFVFSADTFVKCEVMVYRKEHHEDAR